MNGVKRTARNYNFDEDLLDSTIDLAALGTPFDDVTYEAFISDEDSGFWDYELIIPKTRIFI